MRRRNRPPSFCYGHLKSSPHHVDCLLLLGLALHTPCTAKACTMGLQRESSASARRRRNVRDRAMPRPTANRSDHAFFLRTLRIPIRRMLVVLSVVPILHPLSNITGQILHPVG